MASYTAQQLNGAGTPTEELSGPKRFTLTNPFSSSSTHIAYFTVETVRNGEGNYAATVIINGNNITAQTATSITDSTVDFSTLGVEIGYTVTNTVSGYAATVTGVTSAHELALSADVFSADLETYSITDAWPTNALGTYDTFVGIDVDTLITSSYISSVVIPSGVSSYIFTPTATIANNSSMLRATGGITLSIS
jgi:hypothetical protein